MINKATLSGFIVDVHCTSESNLEVEVDCSHIDWNTYKDLILELEDLLSSIDREHSAKSWLVKGRGLRGRYKRVSSEDRRRRLRFSPFPSRFINILKNTRTYVYDLVSESCLVLEKVGRRKLYFLPKHLAPFFVEVINRINEEVINQLKEDVEHFRKSNDYLKIKQTLYKHKIDPSILDTSPFPIGKYMIDILPVDFGYNISEDKVYEMMKNSEAIKGLEILKNQLERMRKEYILNATSEVIKKIVEFADAVGGKNAPKGSVTRIDKLISICTSLELQTVIDKVLIPLKEICLAKKINRPELTEKYFGKKNLKEAVETTLNELFSTQT